MFLLHTKTSYPNDGLLAVLSEDVAGALGSFAADVPPVLEVGAAVVPAEAEVASPETQNQGRMRLFFANFLRL